MSRKKTDIRTNGDLRPVGESLLRVLEELAQRNGSRREATPDSLGGFVVGDLVTVPPGTFHDPPNPDPATKAFIESLPLDPWVATDPACAKHPRHGCFVSCPEEAGVLRVVGPGEPDFDGRLHLKCEPITPDIKALWPFFHLRPQDLQRVVLQ